MEGAPDVERQVEMLLAKRAGVLDWPEGAGRDAVLRAIDSVIAEVETGSCSEHASE